MPMLYLSLTECTKNETESAQRAGETSQEKVPEPPLVLSAWMGYSCLMLIYQWLPVKLNFSFTFTTFFFYHVVVLHGHHTQVCWFVISSREWEWGSKEHQVVSSVSPDGQREEKSGESEGDLQGKHNSPAETDSTLPLCKYSCQSV